MTKITLVPVGGLGNRIEAISTAWAYCRTNGVKLQILWFKDPGLNCDYEQLFSIAQHAQELIEIRNGKGLDFLLRDNPRKKNFWIPQLFERYLFDACFYYHSNDLKIEDEDPLKDTSISRFSNIFLVTCGVYWKTTDMYDWIKPQKEVTDAAQQFMNRLGDAPIGLHIRRTDNQNTIQYSPTSLYQKVMDEEIKLNPNVRFYLASDSLDDKKYLINLYVDLIITNLKVVKRDTREGIIDAFVEMNVLSQLTRIYAGDSSFARISSHLGNVPFILLDTRLS